MTQSCMRVPSLGNWRNTQATMAERAHYGPDRWSIGKWLSKGTRVHLLVIIDAKGLWTKIQNEWKTEKRGTIYVRHSIVILFRIGARVYLGQLWPYVGRWHDEAQHQESTTEYGPYVACSRDE